MPIYEYECQKCKAHTEVMQKMTDKPLTKCRKCGGRLEKQWSPTSFQLKGSGWYVTDYAGKKSEAKEEKASAGKEDKPTKTETKSDSTVKDTPVKTEATKSKPKTTSSKTSGD